MFVQKNKTRKPTVPAGNLNRGVAQAFFSTRKNKKVRATLEGASVSAQNIHLAEQAPETPDDHSLFYLKQDKVDVPPSACHFLISNDHTLAVLDSDYEAKTFFGTVEVLERTREMLMKNKSLFFIQETGQRLAVNGKMLFEVEPLPLDHSAHTGYGPFAKMPFRGSSCNVIHYLYGLNPDVDKGSETNAYGVRLAPPLGYAGIGGNCEETVNGIHELTKVMVEGRGKKMDEERIREILDTPMDKPDQKQTEKDYKAMLRRRKGKLSDLEAQLGVNQFAEPHLGDDVASYMRSNDDEDVSHYAQGHYHGAVVAESADGQDYVCLQIRRRMHLERQRERILLKRYGINADNWSDYELLLQATPELTMAGDDLAKYGDNSDFLRSKQLDFLAHTGSFLRMYGRKKGETYHERQSGNPAYDVPSPLTVVIGHTAKPEDEHRLSGQESPTVEVRSKPAPPSFSSTAFDLEVHEELGILPEEDQEIFRRVMEQLQTYDGFQGYDNERVLHDRMATLYELDHIIYHWHSQHPIRPFRNKPGRSLPEMPVITPSLFRLLDKSQKEHQKVVAHTIEHQCRIWHNTGEDDATVQETWRRAVNMTGKVRPVKGKAKDSAFLGRLDALHAKLIAQRKGRELLERAFSDDLKKKISIDSPYKTFMGQNFDDCVVTIKDPHRAKKRQKCYCSAETIPGKGSDSVIYIPDDDSFSDSHRMFVGGENRQLELKEENAEDGWLAVGTEPLIAKEGEGPRETEDTEVSVVNESLILAPAFIRYGRALEQALHANTGVWKGEDDTEAYAKDCVLMKWGNAERHTVTDEFENELRNEHWLPQRLAISSGPAHRPQGWHFPRTTEVDVTDSKGESWALISYANARPSRPTSPEFWPPDTDS
ncbi:hypothetical protein FUAX_12390 [Fulvitalea axinellae]|uniref:Uncharacterized protein n=1 Tax=Fulvitalea axinellae TaxID=1182444 RepID=A0AAU9CPF4_9BACT|nr:hypothetical protein FUAX_12390 [Fulvitalea axinellae]